MSTGTQWDPKDFFAPVHFSTPKKGGSGVQDSDTIVLVTGIDALDSTFTPDADVTENVTGDVTGESTLTDLNSSIAVDIQKQRKYIVFETSLHQLMRRCPSCGDVLSEKQWTRKGSQISVTLTCLKGHCNRWSSQPDVQGSSAGNLLLPAAILFAGSTYQTFAKVAQIFGLAIISESEFYLCQVRTNCYFLLCKMLGKEIKK